MSAAKTKATPSTAPEQGPTFNETDVRAFYRFLEHRPDEYTELRIIKWLPKGGGQVKQEFVQSEEEFIKVIKKFNGLRQCYAGLNPRKTKGGKIENVARVTAILFDVDAKHPKDEPASDEELAVAKKRLDKLITWIKEQGYESPFVTMSGNGFHVIHKVNMEIDESTQNQLEKYHHEAADDLDSMFDIPRIVKIAGTLSIKGAATEERPHRRSYIIDKGSETIDDALGEHISSIEVDKTDPLPAVSDEQESKRTDTFENKQGQTLAYLRRESKKLDELLTTEVPSGYGYPSASEADMATLSMLLKRDYSDSESTTILRHFRWREKVDRYGYVEKMLEKIHSADDIRSQLTTIDKRDSTKEVVKKISTVVNLETRFWATSKKSMIHYYNRNMGTWPDGGEELIAARATEILNNSEEASFSNHIVNEVIGNIRGRNMHYKQILAGPPEIMVFKNGRVNFETREFYPDFDPDEHHITALPYEYNAEADCPKFEKFLEEICPREDDRLALVEFMGYCLVKHHHIPVFILLTGSGDNGKSTFLNVLIGMLGEENTTAMGLYELSRDKFMKARLYGKLANICPDISSEPIKYTGVIKTSTGKDKMTAQHKHKDPFEFRNYAKLIFSANQIPEFNDTSDAWYKRIRCIVFPNKFTKTDENTVLGLEEILIEEELSGILNLAMQGWQRMKKQKHLTGETSIEEKELEILKRSSPISYFLIRYCKPNEDSKIPVSIVYDFYNKTHHYLKKQGYCDVKNDPQTRRYFGTRFNDIVDYISERQAIKIEGKTIWYYSGIEVDFDLMEKEMGYNDSKFYREKSDYIKRIVQCIVTQGKIDPNQDTLISDSDKKALLKLWTSRDLDYGVGLDFTKLSESGQKTIEVGEEFGLVENEPTGEYGGNTYLLTAKGLNAAKVASKEEEEKSEPKPKPKKAKRKSKRSKKPKEAEDTKYSSGLKMHKQSLERDSKLDVEEAKERREIVKAALEAVQTPYTILCIGKHDAVLKTKWFREEIALLDSIIKKRPKSPEGISDSGKAALVGGSQEERPETPKKAKKKLSREAKRLKKWLSKLPDEFKDADIVRVHGEDAPLGDFLQHLGRGLLEQRGKEKKRELQVWGLSKDGEAALDGRPTSREIESERIDKITFWSDWILQMLIEHPWTEEEVKENFREGGSDLEDFDEMFAKAVADSRVEQKDGRYGLGRDFRKEEEEGTTA